MTVNMVTTLGVALSRRQKALRSAYPTRRMPPARRSHPQTRSVSPNPPAAPASPPARPTTTLAPVRRFLGARLRGRTRVLDSAPDVLDDLDVVDDHQSLADQLVELRQERLDLRRGVHDDHHQGQILAQRQDPRGVDAGRGAVALDPPEDARPGQLRFLRAAHDLVVERSVPVLVRLTDEDREPPCGTGQFHRRPPILSGVPGSAAAPCAVRRRARCAAAPRPTLIPKLVAAPPAARLSSRFATAAGQAPAARSRSVSTIQGENVVYAPRNPTQKNGRTQGVGGP